MGARLWAELALPPGPGAGGVGWGFGFIHWDGQGGGQVWGWCALVRPSPPLKAPCFAGHCQLPGSLQTLRPGAGWVPPRGGVGCCKVFVFKACTRSAVLDSSAPELGPPSPEACHSQRPSQGHGGPTREIITVFLLLRPSKASTASRSSQVPQPTVPRLATLSQPHVPPLCCVYTGFFYTCWFFPPKKFPLWPLPGKLLLTREDTLWLSLILWRLRLSLLRAWCTSVPCACGVFP